MSEPTTLFAQVDVSAWIGGYPFREVPHPDPEVLVRVLQREGVARAWVGWLPSAWQRDPSEGNVRLLKALAPWRDVLDPAPAIRPDWPGWPLELAKQLDSGAAAIRAYPAQWGLGPGHPALVELACACADANVPLHLTVRVEDVRQRHPHDVAGDVPAATVRALARADTACRLVISGAGREFIEEVAWSLTPEERALVWFDFGWVWGPPEEQFARLVRGLGSEQLVYGSQWPLRLVQQSRALVALLAPDISVSLPLPYPSPRAETTADRELL